MITVKELMSGELHTLKPTNTVHEARELMLEKRIRHIPIMNEQDKFVGLITKHDILAFSVSELADISERERDEIESSILLNEVMIRDVVVANEETNLLEAAQFLLEQKHGCLPVFHGTQLIGILTEADFVKLAIYLMKRTAEYQTVAP